MSVCVMQATFGEQLLEVQHVDQIDTYDASASVESVNSHLDMLRPAIQGYGGSVEVLAVNDGISEVLNCFGHLSIANLIGSIHNING